MKLLFRLAQAVFVNSILLGCELSDNNIRQLLTTVSKVRDAIPRTDTALLREMLRIVGEDRPTGIFCASIPSLIIARPTNSGSIYILRKANAEPRWEAIFHYPDAVGKPLGQTDIRSAISVAGTSSGLSIDRLAQEAKTATVPIRLKP